MDIKQSLPQELFAEAIWLEWFANNGYLKTEIIKELLQKYNLKIKKGKTLNDIKLAFGRGLKNTFGNMELARKQIAEEIDKICIIAKWDIAIAKYNGGRKNGIHKRTEDNTDKASGFCGT